MLGLVLCAFFVLGVMTGFSATGRALASRVSDFVYSFTGRFSHSHSPAGRIDEWFDDTLSWAEGHFHVNLSALRRRHAYARPAGGAIALVERQDGFYALFADGELIGPVSPAAADDLPILSGKRVENARGGELVEFAAVMVRAEAQLSHLVSEMNVNDDGTASLYLDRARTVVMIDLGAEPLEIRRAAEILSRWHERESMIAGIDMTTPGQAVVRLAEIVPATRRGSVNKVADHQPARPARAARGKTRSP
jgi:hypothetical protein